MESTLMGVWLTWVDGKFPSPLGEEVMERCFVFLVLGIIPYRFHPR